jgi:uncharacterized membrane protein
VGHMHGHSDVSFETPRNVRNRLILAIVPVVIATIAGLWLLWPSGDNDVAVRPGSAEVDQSRARVTAVDPGGCEAPSQGVELLCSVVTAEVTEGPNVGDEATFNFSTGPETREMQVGDPIILASTPGQESGGGYFFVDYDRRAPLVVLGVLFALVVLALSRLHGLFSLFGVAVSLAVLVLFMMPAILEGTNPVAVAIVGAAAIMFANLYLAHGVTARTTTAILGTMASLSLTGLLAVLFVEAGRFTGFGSEEAAFLQISADQVNLEGLLLGGIVIGTLGVLDDVTITQASAVWELRAANPSYGFRDLYRSAIRIGRDHIASTVNTLVLAYAGASLPLLILFTVSQVPLVDVLNSEVVAEELVRTLVGSIGLVASVPITTALAARVVAAGAPKPSAPKTAKRSRHEREWREDNDTTEEEFWDTLHDKKPHDPPS